MHLSFTTLLLALLPLTLARPPQRSPRSSSSSSSSSCGRRNTPRYCAATNYTPSLLQTYLCGDSRLGPTRLPHASDDTAAAPLLANAILFGYDRLGGLCPGAFLAAWFDDEAGWWRYPSQEGFLLADGGGGGGGGDGGGEGGGGGGGTPIEGNVTLPVDTLVDRFGGEGGTFVSPAGAAFAQRALPPSNLVGGGVEFPYNYHLYSVVKPLEVLAGPVAPWFGQPGAGVQYMLYQSVATLISEGFLTREDPSVLLP